MRLLVRCGYTPGQMRYLSALKSEKPIIFVTGPAGSGKTQIACRVGQEGVESKRYKKLLLTKPAVGVDEEHGFLPGNLDKKMKPWLLPMTDQLSGPVMSRVEAQPLAYMRGRTFERSFIIADEMQNCTPSQMKMILTRLGQGSKMVITGDVNQHDRGYNESGLSDVIKRIDGDLTYIEHVELENDDIMRHPAVSEILRLYGE